jgi:hypothetical protein
MGVNCRGGQVRGPVGVGEVAGRLGGREVGVILGSGQGGARARSLQGAGPVLEDTFSKTKGWGRMASQMHVTVSAADADSVPQVWSVDIASGETTRQTTDQDGIDDGFLPDRIAVLQGPAAAFCSASDPVYAFDTSAPLWAQSGFISEASHHIADSETYVIGLAAVGQVPSQLIAVTGAQPGYPPAAFAAGEVIGTTLSEFHRQVMTRTSPGRSLRRAVGVRPPVQR